MCKTSAPTQMPLNTTGGDPSSSGFEPTVGDDPLSNAIQAEQKANPTTVSVNAPTKFGKLLNIAMPILEGGLIGAAGGKGHPGGGFGAAQEFYNTQRQRNLQMTMLQHTLQNDQFKNALEAARTVHETNQPYFTRGGAIDAQDGQGNPIKMERNPFSGIYEPIPGVAPLDKGSPANTHQTDQGLVNVGKDGTATPVTLPGPTTPPSTAMVPVRGNDPNSPRVPTAVPGSQGPGVPLHAPGFGKPKPTKVTNRNTAGNETDSLIDENPDSPTFGKPLKSGVASRAPVPDKAAGRESDKSDLQARAETYAQAALDKNGGDPDKAIQYLNGLKVKDPQAQQELNAMLPQIRKSIGDRTKSRKPKQKQSALDMLNAPTGSTPNRDDDEQ